MDAKERAREVKPQSVRPREGEGKLVMRGVITHEKLLDEIKERNPVIARRDDKRA